MHNTSPADKQEGSSAQKSVRARIVASGRVQGVAYRAYAQEAAQRCGVRGGVRNLKDGRVEVEAEGERQAIEELLTCLKKGPPRAQVEDVQVHWEPSTGMSTGFQIWY